MFAPYGMNGGMDGVKGENYAWKRNSEGILEKINLGGKAVVTLAQGEVMMICTPGGGGWGIPIE